MITTNSDDYAETIKPMRLHGLNKDAWARQSNRSVWYYQVDSQGYKYNMTDIQAAMGLCQLMKLNKQIEIRRKYVQIYQERLATIPGIVNASGRNYPLPLVASVYHPASDGSAQNHS